MSLICNLAIHGTATGVPDKMEIDYIIVKAGIACDMEPIELYEYDQDLTSLFPTTLTGTEISLGGDWPSHRAIVEANHPWWDIGENLRVIATDTINLLEGFEAEDGSRFSAEIITCPGTTINYSQTIGTKEPILDDSKHLKCRIFPNPNNGAFKIEVPGGRLQSLDIRIYDQIGNVIFIKEQCEINQVGMEIHLDAVHNGIYFVEIKSNYLNFMKKIVIL